MENKTYLGHRKRMKEKYKITGFQGWHDYEILEYALGFSIPRKDTKPLAKDLLSSFKTISAVLDAENDELLKIPGMTEHSVLFLKLLKEFSVIYLKEPLNKGDVISNPEIASSYLISKLKGAYDEEICVLFLNKKNALIASETLQRGSVDSSIIYPRKIVERALYHRSTGIIVAHNHPSGDSSPSKEDIAVTKIVNKALETVEITLLDHIIIAGNECISLKSEGFL